MKAIEDYLANMNYDTLWVDTNAFNTRALYLYKSVGFVEREVGLMKTIKVKGEY